MTGYSEFFVHLHGNQPASRGTLGIPQSLWPPVELAHQDPNVATVLRLIGTQGFTWVNLTNVLDIIQDDLGGTLAKGAREIVQRGWATRRSLSRFRQSANDSRVAGDEARHSVAKGPPPANPMSLPEAQSLIKSIAQSWLLWKESNLRDTL